MRAAILLVCLFVSFVSINAYSSILIEPVVGYQTGSRLELDGNSGVGYSSGKGSAFGGRLGWQSGPLQIGGDFLRGNWDYDAEFDAYDKFTTTELGAFIGAEFSYFRIYGGYIFSATGESEILDSDSGTKFDTEIQKGSGYKAGLSFNLLTWMAVNVEYRKLTFKEAKIKGFGTLDQDLDLSTYLISLSFPFNLGGK